MDGKNIRKQRGIPVTTLLRIAPVGSRLDLEIEDIRRIFAIKYREYPGEDTLAIGGLDKNDLVDAGFEKVEVFGGHATGFLTGARKFTVDRITTSSF